MPRRAGSSVPAHKAGVIYPGRPKRCFMGAVRAEYEYAAIRLRCRWCGQGMRVQPPPEDSWRAIESINGFLGDHRHPERTAEIIVA